MVVVVTSLPYLTAYGIQGSEWRFTGFVFGVEDGNSYIAKMLSGAYGAWLFRTPYTTAPQRGVIAFLPYLLLGKLAAPPGMHEQLVALYHLFRIAAIVLVILAMNDFLSCFVRHAQLRRFGLVLATVGGGLGWVLILTGHSQWLGSLPLEFYSPESFGFLSLYGIPHLALARATLLWTFVVYLRSFSQERVPWHTSVKMGCLWLLTALAQPITAVVLGFVLGLHGLTSGVWWFLRKQGGRDFGTGWRGLRRLIIAGLIPAPFLVYNLVAFSTDTFLKEWTGQNIIRSPSPWHYLLAYGLILPFAILGAVALIRRDAIKGLFLAGWVCALPILAYLPVNLQRRLPEGIWIAMVGLAMAYLDAINERRSNNVSRMTPSRLPWRGAVLWLNLPSTMILLVGGMQAAITPAQPVFRPEEEIRAFTFLGEYVQHPGAVVLASFNTGNALPAWVPVRVLIGHGPESIGLASLQGEVEAFYQTNREDTERISYLKSHQVEYVFWGPSEQQLGDWNPKQASYLLEIYQSGDYAIFKVKESTG